jgi:hypothetical protein
MPKILHKEISYCVQCPYHSIPDLMEEWEQGIYCTFKSKGKELELIKKGIRGIHKVEPPEFCPLPNKETKDA